MSTHCRSHALVDVTMHCCRTSGKVLGLEVYDNTKRSGKGARQSQVTSINQMLINSNLAVASAHSEKNLKDNSHFLRPSSSISVPPTRAYSNSFKKNDLKLIPG